MTQINNRELDVRQEFSDYVCEETPRYLTKLGTSEIRLNKIWLKMRAKIIEILLEAFRKALFPDLIRKRNYRILDRFITFSAF